MCVMIEGATGGKSIRFEFLWSLIFCGSQYARVNEGEQQAAGGRRFEQYGWLFFVTGVRAWSSSCCSGETPSMTGGSAEVSAENTDVNVERSTGSSSALEVVSPRRGKGGRKAANPHLSEEERKRERVLKNRESAMKSLQKKKRYTEDLEMRARLLAGRNQELKDKIRGLLARLNAPSATADDAAVGVERRPPMRVDAAVQGAGKHLAAPPLQHLQPPPPPGVEADVDVGPQDWADLGSGLADDEADDDAELGESFMAPVGAGLFNMNMGVLQMQPTDSDDFEPSPPGVAVLDPQEKLPQHPFDLARMACTQ